MAAVCRPVRLTDHLEKNVAKTVFYYILLVGTWGDFKSRWKINFGSRLQDRVRHKLCNGGFHFFFFAFSLCEQYIGVESIIFSAPSDRIDYL